MAPLTELAARVIETLAQMPVSSLETRTFLHRDETILATGLLAIVALGTLVIIYIRTRRPGRASIVLPALLPVRRHPSFAPLRHGAFGVFLLGLPFFFLAFAAPHTALIQEEVSYPGHRMAILIDSSLSMNTPFATDRLRSGNTFLANVAAAEYFVQRRMNGPYQDLVALVQFGSEAYIVTPFTNDYENILLSIGLISTPEEYRRFPDHGTMIMGALNRAVQLFRTFDFLKATGNLIVIFSDGQDTNAVSKGATLKEILQEASDNEIPVYFIRTSYAHELGDVLSDQMWKVAVERTGGKFFPAANETAILKAIHEIDALAAGRIQLTRYVTRQPRFSPYALAAVILWSLASVLALSVKQLRKFP